MPLLDGKYEIQGERAVADGVTAFAATDPDGTPVRVEWLELPPGDEARFERYRRLLRRLAREDRATIRDVVARPGARYVVWTLPPDGAPLARDAGLDDALREAGCDPAAAQFRRVDGAPKLVALPFGAPAPAVPPPADAPAAPRGARIRLPPETYTWALALGLTAMAGVLAGVAFLRGSNDRVVVVPDVVGVAYEEAAALLYERALRVTPHAVASDDVPAGAVLATDPPPGSALRPGREVRLDVALPAGQLAPTTVPRLVGMTSVAAATDALERAGLALGRWVRIHLDAPADVVLAQSPAAGATVGRGAAVDLVVSLGPRSKLSFLPDLVGLPLADALSLARVAGLSDAQVVVERLATDLAQRDVVLSQSLAPHRDFVVADAMLRLIVADEAVAPPAPDGLPVLGGLSEAEARALAVGFDVRVLYVAESGLPDGVVGQSLGPGARPADGPLVLTVNARPVRIPRPVVEVVVRQPAPRELPYLWFVEGGIPLVLAEVTATTLEGERFVVERVAVSGGGRVEGVWRTTYPGVVRFDLTLNGQPYGVPLRVP